MCLYIYILNNKTVPGDSLSYQVISFCFRRLAFFLYVCVFVFPLRCHKNNTRISNSVVNFLCVYVLICIHASLCNTAYIIGVFPYYILCIFNNIIKLGLPKNLLLQISTIFDFIA